MEISVSGQILKNAVVKIAIAIVACLYLLLLFSPTELMTTIVAIAMAYCNLFLFSWQVWKEKLFSLLFYIPIFGQACVCVTSTSSIFDLHSVPAYRPYESLQYLEYIGVALVCIPLFLHILRSGGFNAMLTDFLSIALVLTLAAILYFSPDVTRIWRLFGPNYTFTLAMLAYFVYILLACALLFALSKHEHRKTLVYFAICGALCATHFLLDTMLYVVEPPMVSSVLVKKFSLIIYGASATLLYYTISITPRAFFTPPAISSDFDIESGNRALTFIAAGALLATPIYSVYLFGIRGNPPFPLSLTIWIQVIVAIMLLTRFTFLFNSVLNRNNALRHAALHDQLTGVLNRRGLDREYSVLQLNQGETEQFSVAFIDINEFTAINNSYGHAIGDIVLKQLSKSLQQLEQVVAIARLGGDEFAVVFSYTESPPYTSEKLRQTLSQWVNCGDISVFLSISAGITIASENCLDSALENADIAMYRAKSNQYVDDHRRDHAERLKPFRQHIKELLQQSIENKNIKLYVQPIYSMSTGKTFSAEVLTRLDDSNGNIIMPGAFLSVARDNQQLERFDELVAEALSYHINEINCTVHLNVSPEIISNYESSKRFSDKIKQIALPIERIIFEITEKQYTDNDFLERSTTLLHSMGFRFALDDFGVGYSSLERVTTLPLEIIKLDGNLLRSARRGNTAAMHAAISLAQHLGATTTCEGVESAEDINLVRQLGGDTVQGFYLCPPMPISEFISRQDDIQHIGQILSPYNTEFAM